MKEMKTFLSWLSRYCTTFLVFYVWNRWHQTILDQQILSFFPTTLYPRRENHFGRLEIEPKFTRPLKPPDHLRASSHYIVCQSFLLELVGCVWFAAKAHFLLLHSSFFSMTFRAAEKNSWWQASHPSKTFLFCGNQAYHWTLIQHTTWQN